jgi:hypothetical protein
MRRYLAKLGIILKTIALLMAVSGALLLQVAEPVLNRADKDFLKEQARLIADSACLKEGQAVGKYRSTTPLRYSCPRW